MSQKYPGGFITKNYVAPTPSSAPGIWTLDQQLQAQKAGIWPFGGPFVYIEDIFSTWLYTGNGGAQIIDNGINLGTSNSGGSGQFIRLSTGFGSFLTTPNTAVLQMGTGDFTVEMWAFESGTVSYQTFYEKGYVNAGGFLIQMDTNLRPYVYANGSLLMTSSTAIVVGVWTHLAVVRSGSTMTMYLNGVSVASASNSTNFNDANIAGIGARSSDGTYPFNGNLSNLRVVKGTAVYTSNFTPPTSALTAISGTSLLTLQNPSPLIDNSGNNLPLTNVNNTVASVAGPFTSATAGKGGLVWMKSRDNATFHGLYDTVRGTGTGTSLYSNTNEAQGTNSANQNLTAFNTAGFTLGTTSSTNVLNGSGGSYVSWTFQEQTKFFDIVTWSGDSTSGRQITHNLGSTPGMVIIKNLAADDWTVWHRSLTSGYYIVLNSTAAQTTAGAVNRYGNGTTTVDPNSTYLTVGSNGTVNETGKSYVAYLFAHNAGGFGLTGTDNVITCSSYTGNGTTGLAVTLGYEPQWVMIKCSSATQADGWIMVDTMRGLNNNANQWLKANSSNAESNESPRIIPTATGFTLSSNAAVNTSGATYIYIAIRKGPMKVPTTGASVYQGNTYTGNATANTTIAGNFGFPVDLMLLSNRSANATSWSSYAQMATDRLRGVAVLSATANTNAESADWTTYQSFSVPNNIGWGLYGADSGTGYLNNSGGTWVARGFRRAPQFFDQVVLNSSTTTYTHNLTIAPELILVKCTNAAGANWVVYSKSLSSPTTQYLNLNTNVANQTYGTGAWSVSSTQFSVDPGLWANGAIGVSYLFATCPGVSKVGSYTGTGALQTVNCGFTGGARFVLIKRTDSTGDWWVYDSARGITSGDDPYLLLNSAAAEVTGTNYVDTDSTGFKVTAAAPVGLNQSGGTYIFLAIA